MFKKLLLPSAFYTWQEGGGEPSHGSLGWAIDTNFGSLEANFFSSHCLFFLANSCCSYILAVHLLMRLVIIVIFLLVNSSPFIYLIFFWNVYLLLVNYSPFINFLEILGKTIVGWSWRYLKLKTIVGSLLQFFKVCLMRCCGV